jgi:mono/diheme cytochrome c family protein
MILLHARARAESVRVVALESGGTIMQRSLSILGLVAGLALPVWAAADKPRPRAPAQTAPAPAAPARDASTTGISGAYAYRTHCASCHGAEGRGDGPMAENLRYQPADLRLIAKRNHGEFPAEKVQRIVDGRDPIKGHGGPDMPIWGDAFKDAETGYDNLQVKEKIRLIVEFVRTLQAK